MHQKIVYLLFMVGIFAAAPIAMGTPYIGYVLYALTPPIGLQFAGTAADQEITFAGETAGYASATGGPSHAVVWTATGEAVDLQPTNLIGIIDSSATGTDGNQQVGYSYANYGQSGFYHALLWTGTADSAVDLNPTNLAGVTVSFASATSAGQQVGYGSGVGTASSTHALLWSGAANSAVDLNPTSLGITYSIANGTDGSEQVGEGSGTVTGNNLNALLWTGTAASAVDLNPTNLTGFGYSVASGVSGDQQVGHGNITLTNEQHALLWTSTAASAVDLNPTDLGVIYSSEAFGTNGTLQVGYGDPGTGYEALLWNDTASSAVNLGALLPSVGTWTSSQAFTVDSAGDVFGHATGTYNGVTGYFAVEWTTGTPVPEPASASLLLVAVSGFLLQRRRKA